MRKQYPSKPLKTEQARWQFILTNFGKIIAKGIIDGLEEEHRKSEDVKGGTEC